jgi:hypothetical protein
MACRYVPPFVVHWGILTLLIVTGISLVVAAIAGVLAYAVALAAVALFVMSILFRAQHLQR